MDSGARILQIVPQAPGAKEGVGDYALSLARELRDAHGMQTTFLAGRAATLAASEIAGFKILAGIDNASARSLAQEHNGVVLHYVNYGYQHRGVPFAFARFVEQLRSNLAGRMVTAFHELYASGPPWKSAFWLRPWQVGIAKKIIALSDVCIVSNEPIERAVHRHDPAKTVRVVPIMSAFGEPDIREFGDRSPHRWAICGGTALLLRSLRSLLERASAIPAWCAPEHFDVIAGNDTTGITEAIAALSQALPGLTVKRHPQISPENASALLARCAFGWLDYFGAGDVWPGMIFKSSSFAAYCAHGIITVAHHEEPALSIGGDALPGPFFITKNSLRLPQPDETAAVREQIYRWYHRHAALAVTAATYAAALR